MRLDSWGFKSRREVAGHVKMFQSSIANFFLSLVNAVQTNNGRHPMRITGFLLAVSTAALVSACAARASQQAPQGFAIAVERPQMPEPLAAYDGPGSVAPEHIYQLSFEIPGRIAQVNYDVGDRVRSGEVLASLDGSDYAAEAAAAAAQAQAAEAQNRKVDNGARPQERRSALDAVDAAGAQVDRAVAATSLAHANYIRAENLYAGGAISAQQRDSAEAAERDAHAQVNAAGAQLAVAQQQRSLTDDGARVEDRAAARAQAAAAAASAQLAQITLGKTTMTAPADSIVQKRAIEPGDMASPGAPAFTLISAGVPDVLVAVPERVLADIRVGTPALVTLGSRTYNGAVLRLEPAADALSRTAQVRVRVPRLDLPAGAVVNVKLGVRSMAGLSIPLGALITNADGQTSVELYDAADQTVTTRQVRIEANNGEHVVVSGLSSSDVVVTQGEYEAKPGDRVRVVEKVVAR